MTRVAVTHRFDVPAARLWELVGGFGALAKWHPAVARCAMTEEAGTQTRELTLADGGRVIERLERVDPDGRSYTYSIVESPFPLERYVATLRVSEGEGGKGAVLEWSGEFAAGEGREEEMTEVVRGIYESGVEALKQRFGGM